MKDYIKDVLLGAFVLMIVLGFISILFNVFVGFTEAFRLWIEGKGVPGWVIFICMAGALWGGLIVLNLIGGQTKDYVLYRIENLEG